MHLVEILLRNSRKSCRREPNTGVVSIQFAEQRKGPLSTRCSPFVLGKPNIRDFAERANGGHRQWQPQVDRLSASNPMTNDTQAHY